MKIRVTWFSFCLKRSLLSSWIDYVLLTDLFAFVTFFSLLITLKYQYVKLSSYYSYSVGNIKNNKKAALAIVPSTLLLGLTTDADSYTFQNGDLFFSIASQGYAGGSICAARSIVCWTDGGYRYVGYVTPVG